MTNESDQTLNSMIKILAIIILLPLAAGSCILGLSTCATCALLPVAASQEAQEYSFQADPSVCEHKPKPKHCNDPQMTVICWCSDLTKTCDWYCVVSRKD